MHRIVVDKCGSVFDLCLTFLLVLVCLRVSLFVCLCVETKRYARVMVWEIRNFVGRWELGRCGGGG